MSLDDKYGAFTIKNIIFYDEEEYNKFLEDICEERLEQWKKGEFPNPRENTQVK